MANTKDEDFVTFLDSNGEEVSNDPRWKAKRLLEQAGINSDGDDELRESLDIETKRANEAEAKAQEAADEIAALRAQLAAAQAGVEEEEEDESEEDKYSSLGGDELKELAKTRGISIKGLTKVGQVRDALRAADAAE